FDLTVPATPAFVLDRFAQEPLPGRRELISTVDFVERLVARFPQVSLADRVYFGHAFRRYEGLVLTLERIGVDELEVCRALARAAEPPGTPAARGCSRRARSTHARASTSTCSPRSSRRRSR